MVQRVRFRLVRDGVLDEGFQVLEPLFQRVPSGDAGDLPHVGVEADEAAPLDAGRLDGALPVLQGFGPLAGELVPFVTALVGFDNQHHVILNDNGVGLLRVAAVLEGRVGADRVGAGEMIRQVFVDLHFRSAGIKERATFGIWTAAGTEALSVWVPVLHNI